jgi:hypothetical protein
MLRVLMMLAIDEHCAPLWLYDVANNAQQGAFARSIGAGNE